MKRRNLKRWQESRLRRLQTKLDRREIPKSERFRCELRELELKRSLWTGFRVDAPVMTRTQKEFLMSRLAPRFAKSIKP